MPLAVLTSTNDADKHELDITSLVFYNNKLYSGADDGKIKMWDEELKLLGQCQAHPCSVFSIAIGFNTLYSCSNDGSVRAWSLDNLKRKFTVFQVENEMYKVCCNSGKLYVGDDHGYIRIFLDNEIVGILEIMHPIVDLLVIGNLIYTARDLYVIITEVDTVEKRMTTLKAIQGRAPVCVSDGMLWFTSRNGRDILVHENSTESDFKPIGAVQDAHELIINALCENTNGSDTYVCSGGWDKTLKKWKFFNDLTIQLTDNFSVGMVITAITSGSNGDIYVGGDDGRILRVNNRP